MLGGYSWKYGTWTFVDIALENRHRDFSFDIGQKLSLKQAGGGRDWILGGRVRDFCSYQALTNGSQD